MHRCPLLIGLLLAVGGLYAAQGQDLLLLDNGQRIAGVIDGQAEVKPDQIAINTGTGIVRIAKHRLKGEDLGYEARRARVADNDLAGLLSLAKWCRAKGMNQEALNLLEKAVALPGADLPSKALYARLVDELKDPKDALELYRAYVKAGGADPQVLDRLAELEKAISDYEARNADTTAPKSRVNTVNEGLETRGWDVESPQWSNPAQVRLVTLETKDGPNRALQIDFKGGDRDKAAIRKGMSYAIGDNAVLSFWVQNPGDKPVRVAVAVKTGDAYLFYESVPLTVAPGTDFQQLKFDLKGSNFKSAATNWANTGKISELGDVKEAQLLIYNGRADGSLIIYGMGFPSKQDM
jgi:tetratricopeptide (TPR) repeat protein